MVFDEVVLSKRKATSDASPESQLSADLSPRSNHPVSNFTHPTLSLLNLSGKLVFNCRIGDVELTMYVGFWGNLGWLFSVPIMPLLGINLAPFSLVVTRYIELRLWLDRCDDVLKDFRTLTDCLLQCFSLIYAVKVQGHSVPFN